MVGAGSSVGQNGYGAIGGEGGQFVVCTVDRAEYGICEMVIAFARVA